MVKTGKARTATRWKRTRGKEGQGKRLDKDDEGGKYGEWTRSDGQQRCNTSADRQHRVGYGPRGWGARRVGEEGETSGDELAKVQGKSGGVEYVAR